MEDSTQHEPRQGMRVIDCMEPATISAEASHALDKQWALRRVQQLSDCGMQKLAEILHTQANPSSIVDGLTAQIAQSGSPGIQALQVDAAKGPTEEDRAVAQLLGDVAEEVIYEEDEVIGD